MLSAELRSIAHHVGCAAILAIACRGHDPALPAHTAPAALAAPVAPAPPAAPAVPVSSSAPVPDAALAAPPRAALACTEHGAARSVPRRLPRGEHASFELDDTGRLQLLKPHADALLHVTGRGAWDVTWHGYDARGAFPSRKAAGVLPVLPPDLDEYELVRATRDGAVIYHLGSHHRLVWLPAGGRPSVVVDERPEFPALEDVLVLPDGTLAVLLRLSRDGNNDDVRLLVIDRTGKVIARRELSGIVPSETVGDHELGIAVIGGEIGMEWTGRPSGTAWFFPLHAEDHRELPAFDLAAAPICAGPAPAPARGGAPIAIAIRILDTDLAQSLGGVRGDTITRAYLRDGPSACIAAIELDQDDRNDKVFAVASPEGDLRVERYGHTDMDAEIRSWRCAVK